MIVGTFAYFGLAIVLCAVGFVGILSIGAPFFLTGIAMLVVSPWRARKDVVWPVIAAPWAFTVTYVLLAPLSCTSIASSGPLLSRTECTNVLGIDYSGSGSYDPPLLPVLLAGLIVAGIIALVLRRLLARQSVKA